MNFKSLNKIISKPKFVVPSMNKLFCNQSITRGQNQTGAEESKDKNYKEDISEDLNRLGNDWKSDPNQQEEAKVGKEEYFKKEGKNKPESKNENNSKDPFPRPEDMNIG